MNNGNWVPIDKSLTKFLPFDREYSKIEAAYSLQIDFNNHSKASVSGYSKLWGWSRKRVRTFIKMMGADVIYPDGKMSPGGGQVGLQVSDKLGTSSAQARLIDFNDLRVQRDKQGTSRGQVGDKQGNTTKIKNNIKTKKRESNREAIIFKASQKYIDFSLSFFKFISEKFGGKKKPAPKQISEWADVVSKLVRIDNYDFDKEIRPALRWAVGNEFWSAQVRSLGTLRNRGKSGEKKFVSLFNQFSAQKKQNQTTSLPPCKLFIPEPDENVDQEKADEIARKSIREIRRNMGRDQGEE